VFRTASVILCELASDEKKRVEVCQAALPFVLSLIQTDNLTVKIHCAQTTALLARTEANHSALLKSGMLTVVLDHLQANGERKLLEGVLASLTHIAKTGATCTYICDLGLNRLLPLLANEGFGVQCNTLAVLGALAEYRKIIQTWLIFELFPGCS